MKKFMCIAIICVLLFLPGCNQTENDEITTKPNEETQGALQSGEVFVYSDEQLTEIAGSNATKDTLLKNYPTPYIRTVSIVQNDISNATPAVMVYYRGETKVLQLMFDGASGGRPSYHFLSTFCSKNEFEPLTIGQSLSDVQAIDPNGEYWFLYTGRNDMPWISTHYTTDGFIINITYDQNNVIEEIDILPM
ncbi:MAG: hypothetical protein J6B84_10020 [Eubacterium sp.]|nr:hypothetical protein [Eubacterium sp.]